MHYRVRVPGAPAGLTEDDSQVLEQRISPGFLPAMGMRLSAGRDFTNRDEANSTPVAIVNEAFVRRFLPGGNPIGQRFTVERLDRTRAWDAIEIVGVVKDSKWVNLREESPVMYYRPYRQSSGRPSVRFAIRTSGNLNALAAVLVQTGKSIDRRIALKNVVPFSEIVNRTLLIERLVAEVSVALGALALIIAAVGLYGVLAYNVARRRREIGVRIAVGASPGSVERMFLRESLVLLAAGFAIGVPAAVFVTRLVSSMLFGLSPGDPATIMGALAVLAAATLAAAYLPARRAAGTDPIHALREE